MGLLFYLVILIAAGIAAVYLWLRRKMATAAPGALQDDRLSSLF